MEIEIEILRDHYGKNWNNVSLIGIVRHNEDEPINFQCLMIIIIKKNIKSLLKVNERVKYIGD